MKDEFIIQRNGKPFVLYAGLLNEAHDRGLKGIDTELIQAPTEENGQVAVCKATVEMEDGRKFSGIGDASPQNVGRNIVPHIIRMSETRSKARALRDAVNVGMASIEELSDDDGPATATTKPVTPLRRGAQQASEAAEAGPGPMRKSQLDLLRTLAEELRGEGGVDRLEKRIGKPLDQLTRAEGDEWIDRLTPATTQQA